MHDDPRSRFLARLRQAVEAGALTKLILGKHRGADATLRQLHVRPVLLKAGSRLSFCWRHATRDLTENLAPAAALARLEGLIGGDFLDAHLFATTGGSQLECQPDGSARLRLIATAAAKPATAAHDRPRQHVIPADAPWLQALGVTNTQGRPREGLAPKFHQIQKFAELFTHLTAESPLPADRPWRVVDMGCGKGYLTFAIAQLLGDRARITGVERRADLVAAGNRLAREHHFNNLAFAAGQIADWRDAPTAPGLAEPPDILIALHACDTATDDALARGVAAGAALLVVAPCCQHELRPQLAAPPVLAGALRHGIFQERQAEFATDALRALLLEWAGWRTKVFEFISTEHTPKNLMIAAIRSAGRPDDALAPRIRDFATFYGITHHALARQLGFPLPHAPVQNAE